MDYHPPKFAIKIPMKPTHLAKPWISSTCFCHNWGRIFSDQDSDIFRRGGLDLGHPIWNGHQIGPLDSCGNMWMRPGCRGWSRGRIQSCLVLTDSWVQESHPIKGLVGKFRWGSGSLGPRQFGLQFSVQDARWQWTQLASPWTDLTRWSSWNELALKALEDKPVLYRNNIRAPKRKGVLGFCEMFGGSNICHLSCFVRFNDCLQQMDTDTQLACFKVGLSEQHIPTVWGLISYVWLFESNFIIVQPKCPY